MTTARSWCASCIKLEPLFQYGVDVGLELVILRGVKQQAEQLSPSTAAR